MLQRKKSIIKIFFNLYFRLLVGSVFFYILIVIFGNTSLAQEPVVLDEKPYEQISLQTAIEKYCLKSNPASLEKMRGVHPRIFLNNEFIAELKKKIKTTHASQWDEARRQAEKVAENDPPAYIGNGNMNYKWGYEQGWEAGVGRDIVKLAFAYVISGEKKYLNRAREYALASCGYPTSGGLGWTDGMDLAASHQMMGLALFYDWCYHDLDERTKQTIRETLVRRASAMFENAATNKVWWHKADIGNRIWYLWMNAYLQNHLWINSCAMATVGLALFDEVEDCSQWIGFPLDRIQRTMASLGDDGASHEGVAYWKYGVDHLLRFMYFAREFLDVDMFDNDWFRKTAMYRLYMSLPRNGWTDKSTVINFSDGSPANWNSSYVLYALAHEYQDGYPQWLAQEIDDGKNIFDISNRWINLLWYDPTIKPMPPTDLPTLHHFTDMEIVSARSDWSGNESQVAFKCGPYIGHKAVNEVPYSAAAAHHVHPDANHFLLFGAGEWLIRDDGYMAKWTSQHNTLLIDGRGQLGEGRLWFDGSELHERKVKPYIVRAVSTPELDQITGDATEEYPRDLGLRRFVRHLLFVKPDVLIVVDEINCGVASDLELRFHPQQQKADRVGNTFTLGGEKAVLRLETLTNEHVNVFDEITYLERERGDIELIPIYTIRLCSKQAKWRNAVALSWTKTDETPVKVTLEEKGDKWIFTAGDRTVVLDWTTGDAEILH